MGRPDGVLWNFYILEDTLVGNLLRPFRRTRKRKTVSSAKFYFFDVGVANLLTRRRNVESKTESYGKVLEHFIFTELRAFLSYTNDQRELSFFRTSSGQEVDFLVGDELAEEVKARDNITERDLRSLQLLGKELPLRRKIVVSTERTSRRVRDVEILPAVTFPGRAVAGRIQHSLEKAWRRLHNYRRISRGAAKPLRWFQP